VARRGKIVSSRAEKSIHVGEQMAKRARIFTSNYTLTVAMTLSAFIPKFLDPYDRPARLYPGLLVVSPAAVLFVCLYGTANIALSSVLSILSVSGVAYALGRVARDAGKRLQDRLFEKWGGAPTTQILRHRDSRLDAHTKERFHGVLSKGIRKTLPTLADEEKNPAAADELYRASAVWLIDQTRDSKKFPLVFKENVAFGFQRNALGLRRLGVTISVVCIACVLVNSRVIGFGNPNVSVEQFLRLAPGSMIALGFAVGMLMAWTFLLSEAALQRTGFAYADRLVRSCDRLTPRGARSMAKSVGPSKSGE